MRDCPQQFSKYLVLSLYVLFIDQTIFFIVQSFLAIYASKGMQVQGRYALIPGVLLIFIVKSTRNVCGMSSGSDLF